MIVWRGEFNIDPSKWDEAVECQKSFRPQARH